MSLQDIATALEARLASIAAPLDTQWENTTYVPVAGKPYQAVWLLPAAPSNPEQNGTLFIEQGFMQVTLRYPSNVGGGDAMTRAVAIRNWFYKGLTLAANGVTVIINQTPTISPGAIDGDRYAVSVKIRFFANVSG